MSPAMMVKFEPAMARIWGIGKGVSEGEWIRKREKRTDGSSVLCVGVEAGHWRDERAGAAFHRD